MLTEFETKLLGIMMIVIMFGMGASLTWRDFLIAFRKPKGVMVGCFVSTESCLCWDSCSPKRSICRQP